MKKIENFDKVEAYKGTEKLPVGAYILKVKNVHYKEGKNGYSDQIVLMFDIQEGEYKDFYARNFENQPEEDKKWKGTTRIYVPKDDGSEKDEWTKRKFKTIIEKFEESNNGYNWNWDESTLKEKLIGGLFNEKEYNFNGREGFFTQCKVLTSVDNIKKGNYKLPDTQYLTVDKKSQNKTSDGFIDIPAGTDEELPF